ncbi:24085_t:CDS:2, partial [Racocetra persica]
KQVKLVEWTKPLTTRRWIPCNCETRTQQGYQANYMASKGHFQASGQAVLIHQLSQHQTQQPFRRSRGLVQ